MGTIFIFLGVLIFCAHIFSAFFSKRRVPDVLFLVIIGILIKLDSEGPVFFFQTRIGKDGKPFRICKFRTMTHRAKGGSITTASQGSNAVFATNGATIHVSDVTIDNSQNVSRGLHATFGGIINASNMNITTRRPTSSTVATDRGGGTVTVTGGTLTALGEKSAVLYSTGIITANNLTGLSEQGPIATVEGSNHVYINDCSMTSHSLKRGILLHQSHSGDAEGTKPVCIITNSKLTTTNSNAPLCFVTNVAATLTLTDVMLNVASGRLMSVEYEKRGNGSTGHLILQTTKSSWTYAGSVDADEVNNAAVTVGKNVTWNGAIDPDNNAVSTKVIIEKGAVWNLTADSYVSSLENNGTINKNGHTLTVGTKVQ